MTALALPVVACSIGTRSRWCRGDDRSQCIAALGQDLLLAADDVPLHVFERFRSVAVVGTWDVYRTLGRLPHSAGSLEPFSREIPAIVPPRAFAMNFQPIHNQYYVEFQSSKIKARPWSSKHAIT
jgi:hypothetical protein